MKHSNSFREDDSYYDYFPSDEDEIQGIKAELKKLNDEREEDEELLPYMNDEESRDKVLNRLEAIDSAIEYYEGMLKRYEV